MSAQIYRSWPLTYNNSEQKDGERAGGALLIQRVSEQFFCTKGMSVYSPLLNASPVYTRSLKQTSLSCELPFFFILRWVFRVSVAPRPDLSALICVQSPPCHWPNGLARPDWWWAWWCQSKRAQSGFGGVQSGGGVVESLEVKEVT